ncbi:simple sugar transport system permease protein/D-xylose transport system permease protein/putative multiple sugar transport system permease protein [Mycoplasma testudineum]|uniref:Xylose transport system permease protein XylH n=1 Tax=Mycoplasma testudineum TaxID=244584 RepID=A0A4V3C393_9MOLU|nr:hypothetical protein [Mycoplasma testudineum]OYD27056.1 sugar ABC transporter permease [Mycoplasma testudineum]TDO21189.1 simple sugar transport system permease protein/D-xylose transport system permease protein/putative multiple sugar transport system permease protein [Mycoplasma testudineum]
MTNKNNRGQSQISDKFKSLSTGFNNTINNLSDGINKVTSQVRSSYRNTTFYKKTSPYTKKIRQHVTKNSMYYILLLVIILFSVWTGIKTQSNILNPNQFALLLRQNAHLIILTLPMLWVIVSGNIDLSVGRLFGLSGYLALRTFNQTNSVIAALIVTLLIGLVIGISTGFLVGYMKIPAFIVTLGGMLLFQGLLLFLSNGTTITPSADVDASAFRNFALYTLDYRIGKFHIVGFIILMSLAIILVSLNIFGYVSKKKTGLKGEWVISFIMKQIVILGLFTAVAILLAFSENGLQLYILYVIGFVALFIFISKYTKFGRAIYAIGGNKKAAALSGVNVNWTLMKIFMIIALVASFGGVIYASVNSATESSAGAGAELTVISSVFVGGASVSGGIGTIIGTVIGSFIINFIQIGFAILQEQAAIINIIQAAILVGVVFYDTVARRKIG